MFNQMLRVCKSWCSLNKSSAFIAIHLSSSSLIQSNHKTQNDGFDQLLLINQGNNFYSLYYGDNPNPSPKPAFQCTCSGLNVPLVVKFGVPARMVGTCNGLTCLSWYPRGRTIIWNPSVGKYVVLPWPCITSTAATLPKEKETATKVSKETHYFGYDTRNDDYKVLRIVDNFCSHTHTPFAVEVYSLARGSWKSLSAAVLPDYGKLGGVPSKSVFVNGTLHWVQLRDKEEQEHGQEHINIMSFDLSTELFGEIMMPEALRKRGSNCVFLKYGESLALIEIEIDYTVRICRLQVWVMKTYGVAESWTEFNLSVRLQKYYRTLDFERQDWMLLGFKSQDELVFVDSINLRTIVAVDLKTNKAEDIGMFGSSIQLKSLPLVESLVLLDHPIAVSY